MYLSTSSNSESKDLFTRKKHKPHNSLTIEEEFSSPAIDEEIFLDNENEVFLIGEDENKEL